MFFDLNIPVPSSSSSSVSQAKKGKGKQAKATTPSASAFSPSQVNALESRIDLLLQLGYTVLAFNQVVDKKVDTKSHCNVLDSLLPQLKQRPGVVFLKRLTIILDEDSEKGFGLINANIPIFNSYDLISLLPTSATTFSLACLTHSLPSPLTAHIISLPLTLPRLPFRMKHTLIRTALKNGAVFEINYIGALGGENDPCLVTADAAINDSSAKRNWWAASRELCRVTKGKGILVSSGAIADADLRAPRDIGNIISLLDVPQNTARDSMSTLPRSLVRRAETRKTYRAVLSEPKVVIPENPSQPKLSASVAEIPLNRVSNGANVGADIAVHDVLAAQGSPESGTVNERDGPSGPVAIPHANGQKRPREDVEKQAVAPPVDHETRKKKRKKNKEGRGPTIATGGAGS
ncbi:RNase P protein component 3 family protein [Pleurotus pulmonarius]